MTWSLNCFLNSWLRMAAPTCSGGRGPCSRCSGRLAAALFCSTASTAWPAATALPGATLRCSQLRLEVAASLADAACACCWCGGVSRW